LNDVPLGRGVRVQATTPIVFTGPFGRIDAADQSVNLTLDGATGHLTARVDLIGVTGKVVYRAIH
jgi:hypothetical protein